MFNFVSPIGENVDEVIHRRQELISFNAGLFLL